MDKNHLVEEEGEGKSLNFIEQIIFVPWKNVFSGKVLILWIKIK